MQRTIIYLPAGDMGVLEKCGVTREVGQCCDDISDEVPKLLVLANLSTIGYKTSKYYSITKSM